MVRSTGCLHTGRSFFLLPRRRLPPMPLAPSPLSTVLQIRLGDELQQRWLMPSYFGDEKRHSEGRKSGDFAERTIAR
ncbi:hypothetical protein L1887_15333 [Cichorium endivia]|nr:hypothetical protein L1887_15333 [Cichorium endivia]